MSNDVHLRYAIRYAELGWHIFPMQPRSKRPLLQNGFNGASNDLRTIEQWWRRFPLAGIGLNTELSGIAVIDLDGELGIQNWQSGFPALANAPCGLARSGGGGLHRFYRQPTEGLKLRCSTGVLAQDIDTKGIRGCITVPPSIHPSGNRYVWLPQSVPLGRLPILPPELLLPEPPTFHFSNQPVSFAKAEQVLSRCYERVLAAESGQRNAILYKATFRLYKMVQAGSVMEQRVLAVMQAAGAACGLEAQEIQTTIKSARKGALR